MSDEEKAELIAIGQLLESIKSMAESQAQLVEIAQSILKEMRRKPKDNR